MSENKQALSHRLNLRMRFAWPLWMFVASVAILLCPWLARGQNYKLCFPSTVWYGSPSGPTIQNFKLKVRDSSGTIWPDDDWRGAFRYAFGNGTTTPDVVVQGIRDSSNLYVYVEANNLSSLTGPNDQYTLVLLIFNQGSTYQMIGINPVVASPNIATTPGTVAGGTTGAYNYWQATCSGCNPSQPIQWGIPSTPTWLQRVGYLQYPANDFHWYLEMQLPITSSPSGNGVFVPSTGTFNFYINILRVVNNNYSETWWPTTPTAYEIGCESGGLACKPTDNNEVPAPTYWGTSTIDPAQTCGGVSVGSQINDIYTGNSPTSKISTTVPNTFHAYVQNTSVDGNGNPIAANQVTATFKIENWGLGNKNYALWQVPGTGPGGSGAVSNDPTPLADIPATVCTSTGPPTSMTDPRCILSTGQWSLNSTEVMDYSTANMAHQCILVELDSAPYTVNISSISRSANVVTVNTASNHPFPLGQKVTITGVANGSFDGSFLISSITPPTQFQYQQNGVNVSSTGGNATGGVAGNTIFLNNTAVQNMNFGLGASTFERVAEISAKGYPPRPDNPDGTHNPGQLFDLHVFSSQEVLKSNQASTNYGVTGQGGSNREPEKGRVVSQLTWVLNGCRHTGRYMLVDDPGNDRKEKRKIDLCDPVGAFGYIIRHRGKSKVRDWNVQLTGPGLKAVPGQPNTYQILIPQDGVATVTTHAEPQEQGTGAGGGGKIAVFLDAGAGIPQGTFGNVFKTGFSFNGGLEYIASSHFSAEGIFGYHHFPVKATAGVPGAALNIYQFSGNGKFYLSSGGSFRPFVNGGIGGYDFTPGGGTHFGGNVGVGVLREFGPHWGLQGSYNFHAVNTPGGATKFSTIQGGIRFVF